MFTVLQRVRDLSVVDFVKFSCLGSLLRVCALLSRFLTYTKNSHFKCDARDLLYCLWIMQQESFHKETEFLQKVINDPSITNPPGLVNRLNLFLNENDPIRSKSRLFRSKYYDFEIVSSILLAKNHYFTLLIVKDANLNCKHLGIQVTLTYICLRGYWITSTRVTIKRVSYPKFTNFSKAQVQIFRPFVRL